MIALAGAGRATAAQSLDCPVAEAGQSAYLICQIDVAPTPVIDTGALRDMEYAACSGAEFHVIVTRDGGVREAAVSDDTPGARLCENFALTWRFQPGTVRGRTVDVRMATTLRYTVPKRADLIWDPSIDWQPGRAGYVLSVRWAPAAGNIVFSTATRDSAFASVVKAVASHGRLENLDHYCVDLGDSQERTPDVIGLTGDLGAPTYSRDECPSIIQLAGGGVGYVRDPPYLHVGIRGSMRPASSRAVVVDAWYARGMGGAGFVCRAERVGLIWRARCLTIWSA